MIHSNVAPIIFVVDDEIVIAQSLAEILRKTGYAAIPFINPWEALERAKLQSPDFLLSDVWMPELSGIDLAIQVRAFVPNCGILLFSGQAATSDLLSDAHNFGYDFHLIEKPVHPVDLLKKIDGLLQKSVL